MQSIPALATAPPAAAAPDAVTVLLRQARFWRDQYQNDRAIEALNRALILDPANAAAAALLARIEADQGDSAKATAALNLLRQNHPADPDIAQIEGALRIGVISPPALAEARTLARQGHNLEAVQRYNAIFRGNPPPEPYEVEYYQALAGTEGGWETARDALARAVRANPQDSRAALAYAELLTYREASRADGIDRLVPLASRGDVGAAATRAWRQALLWLPIIPASIDPLAAFLLAHPDDADIKHQLGLARTPQISPQDAIGQQRQAAFKQLEAGQLEAAARLFEQVLTTNPDDPDAIGGLGLVRLRQGRQAEASSLLRRAIGLDPAKRSQWQAALDGASVAGEYGDIRSLTERGAYAEAERRIRALMRGGGDTPALSLMLANVQSRLGDSAGAEATYRAALQRQPASSAAMIGLAGVLERQGRFADAEQLLTRAGAAGSLRQLGQIRAERLRDQAASTPDVATRESLLEQSVAADPQSPWSRLELARVLVRSGQLARAKTLMAASTAASSSDDALQAGIVFDSENGLLDDAAALAGRVPASGRSAGMRVALAQLQVQQSIAAAGLLPAPVARARLLALAAAPDPDGVTGAAIARALFRMNDADDARLAIAAARAATPVPTAEQSLNYAAASLEIGDTRAARLNLAAAGAQGLTPLQQGVAAQIGDGLAVREADRLNQEGRQAAAYDLLAPALARTPDDPGLNLVLGRLYQSANDPRRALAISLAVLRRDPANADARHAAVAAAIAAGDRGTADQLVREGQALTPDDPQVWLASAELDQTAGDDRAALRDFRRARDLRVQQMGGDMADGAEPPAAWLSLSPAANPFRQDSGGVVSGDPMTVQIDQSIAALRDSTAPAIQAGVGLRGRTGTSGLSRLTDASVPLEASFSPGGFGRIRLLAQPEFLSAGSVGSSAAAQAQLGSQALGVTASPTAAGAAGFNGRLAGAQNASGVGLDLAYQVGWINADFGATPIGFPLENIVGGVVLAPKLTNDLTLRLTAERRAVTDSLLSYGGQRDPRTGGVSGGVVRNRAYAQLELSAGLANFYAGAGYDSLIGQNVVQNSEIEGGGGVGFPVFRNGPGELRTGLDLVYFGFGKNLGGFTTGQGGYFSPQSYFAALVPLTWSSRYRDLTYSIGGALGFQVFNSSGSAYYPGNAALQSQLQSLAAGVPGLATSYAASNVSGLAGNLHGALEYQLTPSLKVGARASFQHAGDYSEGEALLYARYIFNGAD
jgi:predicted Zn-dependent protease